MSKKVKIAITSIICFILFIAVAFMITSLTMASVNDRSLVDEWKSWGTEIEEVVDGTDDGNTEETEEPTQDTEQTDDDAEIVVDEEPELVGEQSMADNYSNVVIVA